jgi:Family of unknown function (DUF6174)
MPPLDPATDANDLPPGTNPAAAPGRRRLPSLLLVGLLFVALIVALIIVLEVFAVRRIPELTEPLLQAAEQRWQANGPASYDLDLEISGAQPGVVHVEVRDGEVTAMTRDGVAPEQRRTWAVWAVPGQFETIERELEMAEDPVHEMQAAEGTRLRLRAEFDPEYGYPRQFQRMVYGGGPEVYWQVTKFQPLPTPGS